MIAALLYLQYQSTRNRLTRWFRRLKQPKYLAMALAGGVYIYFFFFRHVLSSQGRPQLLNVASQENLALFESLGALMLFLVVVLAWLIPHERAALNFSEAEIAFLFPAPLSRQGLVHFKLLRSQFRIFITILFLTLLSNRLGGNAWIHAAGWWLVLSILNLHLLGSSFARTLLLDRGISNWFRRGAILVLLLAFVGYVILWARQSLPALEFSEGDELETLKRYAQQVLASGPVPYLLYPFRLVVRPYFSPDAAAFVYAAGPAILLLALHYWWVVRSNVAFEEASVEAAQKLAVRVAAIRSGNWRGSSASTKKRRAPFKLKPTGYPAIALFWKNLISAGRIFSPRLWILLVLVAAIVLSGSGTVARGSGLMPMIGALCGTLLGWSIVIGPQLLRQDLRQDLVHADVLKLFPMRGWQIVLGELLAPAVILTALQWVLLIFASNLLWRIPRITPELGFALVASIAILLPALNMVMLLIPNAGVLLFPAWFQTGKDGPQGIEATGQRLILLLGQLLAFAVTLIPAAIFFLLVFFIGRVFLGPVIMILPASAVAMVVLAAEAWVGVMLLGKVFERFDLSAELGA